MHTFPLALTLDLDDTLWPIWPTIEKAENVLHGWLSVHAPATARRFDRAGLRALRDTVTLEHPEWAHDFSVMRLERLRRALVLAGDDPAHAQAAFDVFFGDASRRRCCTSATTSNSTSPAPSRRASRPCGCGARGRVIRSPRKAYRVFGDLTTLADALLPTIEPAQTEH